MFEVYPLVVNAAVRRALELLRAAPKFEDLPGLDTGEEQARCSALVDAILDRVINGIEANPCKSWVLEQCLDTLTAACHEDTEARERFGPYLERMMDILGIASSDGMLTFYLTFGGVGAA